MDARQIDEVLTKFLECTVAELTRAEMLTILRADAERDFALGPIYAEDWSQILEDHRPWRLMSDGELRSQLADLQRSWLQDAVEAAERQAGWDPNP